MTARRGPGGDRPAVDLAARVLASARAASCRAAEVFIKTSASRQVAWEPPLRPEGPAHVAVSHAVEAGAGLLVIDAEGRPGLAWRGGGPSLLESPDDASIDGLVADALAAACAGGAAHGAGDRGAEARAATVPIEAGAGATVSLDLVDPECRDRPESALVALVEAAALEVATAAEGALEVDRILVTEARTSVRLVRLDGFDGAYERTIAALSIALVPAVVGAEAVTEERSACRLDDLDPRLVARDAIVRGLPPRVTVSGAGGVTAARAAAAGAAPLAAPEPTSPPRVEAKPTVVLAPRAAATLLAALAPWVTAGAISVTRPSALSIVDDGLAHGRPGSAPFDGSGRPTRRLLLLDRGRAVARLAPETGPFQRPSYRDLPVAAPAGLAIVPDQQREKRRGARSETAGRTPPAVTAAVIEVRTGTSWVVQVRRGDWDSGVAADGLYWEGTPAALVQAVTATLDDPGYYQVGLPVAAPTVVLEGLGPWRMPGAGD